MGTRKSSILGQAILLLLILLSIPVFGEAVRRPAGSPAALLIPDHFLRSWDPVTVFFDRDLGPAQGGAEDRPERFVRMSPLHPGAFTWLDARTLQFKPAEAWPPLARFTWKAAGQTAILTTLMAAPLETLPANNQEGLEKVESITMTFAEPLDVTALAQMLTIELRPLPGVGGGGRWLTSNDFAVKPVERQSRADAAAYVVQLNTPIAQGIRALAHLRLSLDDTAQQSFAEITFSTAEPFRILSAGCYERRYPVTPEGSRYTQEQAIRCVSADRKVVAEFSSSLRQLGPVEAKNLVRISPPVDGAVYSSFGKFLEVSGKFAPETLYRVTLTPTPMTDAQGRPLDMQGESELYIYFPRQPSYLQWGAGEGVLERFGPQMLPLKGRGMERVDLRIFPVNPLDRSFWPFPKQAIAVDESQRPPGPGEEAFAFQDASRNITQEEISQQIVKLTSPPFSQILTLPLRKDGSAASFGLDLAGPLASISGPKKPGTYLVGLRRLDSGKERSWMRIQVTDLSLSTAEEPLNVHFAVTSLSTSQPVPGALIHLEGTYSESGKLDEWRLFAEGTTGADGIFSWNAPGGDSSGRRHWTVRRIVVSKGDDTLVLDPAAPPQHYADNQWFDSEDPWLQWAYEDLDARGPDDEYLCHIFTERPVYRPEETVHIKGYLRRRSQGVLARIPMDGYVVVNSPAGVEFRYPVTLNANGSFYYAFSEKNLPTGEYSAHWEDAKRNRYGNVAFRMEAYRVPQFEVQLHSDDRVPLDREFSVKLTASYYAGGTVAGQPVQWRVTQFPYTWIPKNPKGLTGFNFSSDGRFSNVGDFDATPRLEKQDTTDEKGGSEILLNPALEATSQPRSYVVEATVTGPDDQTVTATRSIAALPPFVLGLRVPRYLEQATAIEPQIIAVGPDEKLLSGTVVTVRLLNRQWHSLLRESDFSDGVARYTTDVVDEKVFETTVTTEKKPITVSLPVKHAGVYIVELESRDRLDRAQTIAIDLYAGGDEPVTWAKPSTPVFSVAMDRENYDPGMTASLVLKSPYQQATALVIVEAPDGNHYQWIPVKGGVATFTLPIVNTFAPNVPVHFILLRGRIPGVQAAPGEVNDLGKPATMAATAWVKVNPVDNRINIKLDYPAKARPSEKIQIKVQLSTPQNQPLPGEVTLWLVDQAVLALGKEQLLDPVPAFITAVKSYLEIHDTRNMAFGYLPFSESPGGDQAEEESNLLEKVTVRRNFKTVPYYNPDIAVGPDGSATITVELPDNLTNFKIRAKAVSGDQRFGFATGQLAVRLPVIIQPALPRFVRPGDAFTAAAIGRIVEGPSGPGAAEIRTSGVNVKSEARKEFNWTPDRPERIEFPVEVPTPQYNKFGNLLNDTVSFTVGVERKSDGARDAFEVKLPLIEDRPKITLRLLQDLEPGKAVSMPEVPEPTRAGTVRRAILVSGQPGLVQMAAGLDFLLDYPHGCTEQRLSRARTFIALKTFRDLLHQQRTEEEMRRAVKDTMDWIPTVIDSNGLVAFWPGTEGHVVLTAWTVQFLVEAKKAGFVVDDALMNKLIASLERALRSDYSHFITGEEFEERSWALSALADAGKFNSSYAAELARKSQYLDLEGVAQVIQSFSNSGDRDSATVHSLSDQLWNGLVIRLHQDHEIYGGLQERRSSCSPLILPTETRTLAEMTRALSRTQQSNPKLQVLVNALVTLGRGDGWGTTNANASALLALSELLQPPFKGIPARRIELRTAGLAHDLSVGPEMPVQYMSGNEAPKADVLLQTPGKQPVILRAETSYVPAADGSHIAPKAEGFVVTRELLRFHKLDEPAVRTTLSAPGTVVDFAVGDVVEDHVQLVNPKDRNYVAVVVPLAAGMEPLNPNLAIAPPEAAPSGSITLKPSYAAYLDDRVAFYYNTLPRGTYDFYFRAKATVPGSFTQPAAQAEMMYDGAVRGNSAGARVKIQ